MSIYYICIIISLSLRHTTQHLYYKRSLVRWTQKEAKQTRAKNLGHICASRVVGLVAPHVARHRSNSKMSSPRDSRPPRALRASRRLPFHRERARERQFREKRRKKKKHYFGIAPFRGSTRLRDDDTTNDVSKIKAYLDVVERPFTEEFHFLRGEFSHDVRALCVARCSFSRFSQLFYTQQEVFLFGCVFFSFCCVALFFVCLFFFVVVVLFFLLRPPHLQKKNKKKHSRRERNLLSTFDFEKDFDVLNKYFVIIEQKRRRRR